MKFTAAARAVPLAVAAALLGVFILAQPLSARAADRHMPTAEAQISQLRKLLHITKAQMPQWEALAAAMRENARLLRESAADRAKIHPTTIVDRLYTDRKMSQARLKRLERLIPLAEALYAVLSPRQKAKADILFTRPRNTPY